MNEKDVVAEEDEEAVVDESGEEGPAEIRIVLNAHEELKRLLPMEGN